MLLRLHFWQFIDIDYIELFTTISFQVKGVYRFIVRCIIFVSNKVDWDKFNHGIELNPVYGLWD
jgi:hypothetical protein